MTTAEMERRLVVALRSADGVPVDVATARESFRARESDQQRAGRRLLLAAAAALVVAGLTLALVARLVHPGPSVPPARVITVSPSGLPVGEMLGRVRLIADFGVGEFLVVIVVRPDGTGSYGSENLGGTEAPFEVTIRPDSQGRAVLGYSGPVCTDPNAVTFDFTVHARTVTIDEAIAGPGGCMLSPDDAPAFRGVNFRVRPSPDAR